ncbi:related to cAMP-independent regulatory protein pac2 [Sporisorium reilianum SRZ2]|uniref:Related to cAMP-independent regulatory protein pac2 n=1 Tax=Sporisorium reilianum (strain SRZ2) TaxID=999809 RepID=E7A0R6_SPORE|nr:related to cAMP-independent regulatory protein pac2 [Sporisorium reilianum SRZ2]
MPAHYSDNSYPSDRYSHRAEPASNMHSYATTRYMPSRPDFARSQTMPRGPIPGPPHGPMYPDHAPSDRAYAPHHAPPHPTYTRHHHSYYDERGPLPPPPLHHRHSTHHQDAYYAAYDGRSPTSSNPAQPHAPYGYSHHAAHAQYPAHAAHPHHPHNAHHASFSSTGSSASSSLHAMRASISHPMAAPTGSQQQPTYRGHIKTTKDAILLLAACDLVDDAGAPGVPPPRRVNRRLLDSERAELICSGSIFVWDEKEAGMRRWTDGKCWSASRVSGCFLTYRELEARKKPSSSITGGPTSNLYKAEGLIKQSFSMTTTSGRKLHVISYYTKRDVREGLLRRVSEDPRFVGESGGEWGLCVDEAEYPDPISRAGDLPPGVNPDDLEGSQSPPPASAHIEAADLRASRGPAGMYRNASPGPRAHPAERAMDRSRVSPSSREPHPISPRESASRRDLDAYRHHVKAEPLDRLRYAADATPLHEARGLLPIRPIPVDSQYAELTLRRSSNEAAAAAAADVSPRDAGMLYGRKRSYQDFRGTVDDAANEPKPTRPRLQRMRSSSMSNPYTPAQDVLAPIRPMARAGSDDEGVSKLRSTHAAPVGLKDQQHDSAVGALLSLRSGSGSGSSDDSMPLHSKSPATTAPSSAEAEDVAAKPAFSRMDRAALDQFSVRI